MRYAPVPIKEARHYTSCNSGLPGRKSCTRLFIAGPDSFAASLVGALDRLTRCPEARGFFVALFPLRLDDGHGGLMGRPGASFIDSSCWHAASFRAEPKLPE